MKQKKRTYSIISLFPDFIEKYVGASIIGRAQKNGLVSVTALDLRQFATDKHQKVDDRPYGGGPGMVLKAEPILGAVTKIFGKEGKGKRTVVILTTPRGKLFDEREARRLARTRDHIVFIAGRYEGIDARVKQILKPKEYSVGPYVLTGGELPALTMLDAIVRYIPGVLGDPLSLEHSRVAPEDTFTRPETIVWRKKRYVVPEVLVSGHHARVATWRSENNKQKRV